MGHYDDCREEYFVQLALQKTTPPKENPDRLPKEVDDKVPYGEDSFEFRYPEDSALNVQEGGSHYKDMKIQPIEYITANKLDFLQGNIIKYITRHKEKNGIEDINKIIHYCKLIKELQYEYPKG